ncbi:MAG: tetratricopeptide repeat protein [Gammaproteobacteria bacterium]|nr:tetratricopeptide repeat protein [Gammaproteobacteria bacterium]
MAEKKIALVLVIGLIFLTFFLSDFNKKDDLKSENMLVEKSGLKGNVDKPEDELQQQFQKAAKQLNARQYDDALKTLHRVLELAPDMPEAHSNMGYILLGMERYDIARDYFLSAIDLNGYQENAYWGLAVAYEKLDDLPAAMGAMRSYIHMAPKDDPFVRRARSALWEWETALVRGPLPEAEQEWLDRNQKLWEERNSATVDGVEKPETEVILSPIK